jgi:hypothetical protein
MSLLPSGPGARPKRSFVVGTNDFVDERLWSKVVQRCSEIRQASSHDS